MKCYPAIKLNKLDANNKLDESLGNYTEWKKKNSSERLYDSIYVILSRRGF